jgi:hypothetical protein
MIASNFIYPFSQQFATDVFFKKIEKVLTHNLKVYLFYLCLNIFNISNILNF